MLSQWDKANLTITKWLNFILHLGWVLIGDSQAVIKLFGVFLLVKIAIFTGLNLPSQELVFVYLVIEKISNDSCAMVWACVAERKIIELQSERGWPKRARKKVKNQIKEIGLISKVPVAA